MRNIKTIDYYNKNADEFIENTLHADMHDAHDIEVCVKEMLI